MSAKRSRQTPEALMLIVHVHIQVKPDQVDAFKAASVENSRQSLMEPGIARFDVLQQHDDPTKFLLVEICPHARRPRRSQGNSPLQDVGADGGRHDGRAAVQRQVQQSLPSRRVTMKFEFATAGRIVFGPGCSRQLPDLAKSLGTKALLVLGRSGRGQQALIADLAQAGVRSVPFHVEGEPTVVMVDQAKDLAMDEECELLIAVGGGSVIDAGKAAAGMLNNPGAVLDYLEVVGGGKPLRRPAMPWIAVPTTAGTGAEVTRNAVLDVPDRRVKVSLRSQHLLPAIAVIDPELTLSLPPAVTAFTGMDALTQLIEPFVSNAANPITDGVCREGLRLAARSLATAFHDGTNLAARTEMSAAALLGGIALANAKLGAVHGLAGVLGGATGHPHGAISARLLPLVMEANIHALQDRPAGSATLARYAEVAQIITADPSARPGDGVAWVNTLCVEFQIPPLRQSGLTAQACAAIVPAAQHSSMKGNPVSLPDAELLRILGTGDLMQPKTRERQAPAPLRGIWIGRRSGKTSRARLTR